MTEAPEIPEGVETREVEALLVGLEPFALLKIVQGEQGPELALRWGGGLGTKAEAAHLLSQAVTNLVLDLAHDHSHDHSHDPA